MFMPSTTSDQNSVPATDPELRVGESRLGGRATSSAGILYQGPGDLRRVLPDELGDELLAGAKTEQEMFGPAGLFSQLTKRLAERAMEVELTDHLGYEPHAEPPGGVGNIRNASPGKTLITEKSPV